MNSISHWIVKLKRKLLLSVYMLFHDFLQRRGGSWSPIVLLGVLLCVLCCNILCYFMYFMWYFVGLRCTIICQLSLTLHLSLLFLPIVILQYALWYPIYAFLLYRLYAFYIQHNNTHLLTLLLALRHCLYPLRHSPKHILLLACHKMH